MIKYYDWKKNINKNELEEVINILKNNGIVIFPTETVYGIGGNALSNEVIDKIYDAKKRPRAKAVNIIVQNIDAIKKYAEITSDLEEKIIKKCMPGPITLILKKKENFGNYFAAEDNTIGVRIPDNSIIATIISKVDFPIAAPSANISGEPSGIDAKDIINDFKETADAIIDGGKAKLGLGSTIIKVVNNDIKILRQGKMTKEEILSKL